MEKVIKEIKDNRLIYKLGYDLMNNKIRPEIEIYKGKDWLATGCWRGSYEDLFIFDSNSSSLDSYGVGNTIKEMFIGLRKYNEIPLIIEKEFEEICIN